MKLGQINENLKYVDLGFSWISHLLSLTELEAEYKFYIKIFVAKEYICNEVFDASVYLISVSLY